MHDHVHHDRHAHHHHGTLGGHALSLALLLTLGYAVVEAGVGLWSGSLTLLGDAGHMLTDSVALGLAALAGRLAQRPPSTRHSYGLGRIEVIAAVANALLMLLTVIAIGWEALQRLRAPAAVQGEAVMFTAVIGLLINAAVAFVLTHGEETLNVRAALLHVMGDLLGSVAAIVAGAVIWYSGWTPIDPLLALVICGLILYSTVNILREGLHVMLEGVPPHLDLPSVGLAMAQVPQVCSVHDLHIWALGSGKVALSAHLVLNHLSDWTQVQPAVNEVLHERFAIEHTTLQPEVAASHVLIPMPVSKE